MKWQDIADAIDLVISNRFNSIGENDNELDDPVQVIIISESKDEAAVTTSND